MIELDVQTRRKTALLEPDEADRYLVLADLGGPAAPPAAVDRDTLDAVLDRQGIVLGGARIRELEDFHPDRLYRRLEAFRDLREGDLREGDLREEGPPHPEAAPRDPKPDLKRILSQSSLLEQIAQGGDPFEQYVRELARAHAAAPAPSGAQKDSARSERMRAVLRHPRVQSLEAVWRGLDFVARRLDDSRSRVSIVQLSKLELERDLLETEDLRSTRLQGLLRARPWRAVFGLHSFAGSNTDIELLGRIALLVSHAKTSFVAEGSADMGEHWEELRSIPEAGSIGLVLPRFLLRIPYGARTSSIESFPFEEMPGKPEHGAYLWGNAALACLAVLTREVEDGGADEFDLRNLPLHTYQQDGEWTSTPCAEVCLTESQVRALVDLGLMPLLSFRDTDWVRLAGLRAINGNALPL